MPTVTLQDIKATQDTLAAMIANYEAQAAPGGTLYTVREAKIELAPGERYAGVVLDAAGSPSHHLVLLPGEARDVSWQNARAWAGKAGGALPTRQEQALLYANCKAEFAGTWYWTGEEHESDGSCAWVQYFLHGNMSVYNQSYQGRARAVRRFIAPNMAVTGYAQSEAT